MLLTAQVCLAGLGQESWEASELGPISFHENAAAKVLIVYMISKRPGYQVLGSPGKRHFRVPGSARTQTARASLMSDLLLHSSV